MNREQTVKALNTELRKACSRRARLLQIEGCFGERFLTADGVMQGIIRVAAALDISLDEIREGVRL